MNLNIKWWFSNLSDKQTSKQDFYFCNIINGEEETEGSDQQSFSMETIRKIVFQHYHKNSSNRKRRKHLEHQDFCNGKIDRHIKWLQVWLLFRSFAQNEEFFKSAKHESSFQYCFMLVKNILNLWLKKSTFIVENCDFLLVTEKSLT